MKVCGLLFRCSLEPELYGLKIIYLQAFYHPTRLGLVEPPAKISAETWVRSFPSNPQLNISNNIIPQVFVYGGSTSVGQFAVQLAHLSGYKVATVASPHNHAFVKSLGADAVFDVRGLFSLVDINRTLS